MLSSHTTTTSPAARPTFRQLRHIPPNATAVTVAGVDAVVYTSEGPTTGGFYGVGYRAKCIRSAFNYRFKSEEQRAVYIRQFFDGVKATQDYKDGQKAATKAKRLAGHGAVVGDIYYTSWGYDQTNVDFYEVTAITPGSITVRPLKQSTTETGFMCGNTVPHKGQVCGEEIRCMFTGHGFKAKRYHLSKWNGQPQRCSWYA